MTLINEQIEEVCNFQSELSYEDEWLFFHIACLRAIEEGDYKVTFEDKYEAMMKFKKAL